MIKVNGIHHIAIMAADIKSHIEVFSDVLGCELSAIFDMHGVPGGSAEWENVAGSQAVVVWHDSQLCGIPLAT